MKKMLIIGIAMSIFSFSEGASYIRTGINYTRNKVNISDKNVHTVLVSGELEYLFPVYENSGFKVLTGVGINGKIGGANIFRNIKKQNLLEIYAGPYVTPQISYDINDYLTARTGFKLGVGLNVHEVFNYDLNNDTIITPSATLGIPMTFVLGVDIGRFTSNFEIGSKLVMGNGKLLTEKNNFLLITSLSIGYKF
ncbi:hypothetical protein [Oceanivirga salmonicida]|uniref:hypothetical protein n=1 Tax=Oceanivirga salmonicida TaxID=1769291 RepID=UPI00082BCA9B|nr:hypothetical protein [Oceanivirga salmonicida]